MNGKWRADKARDLVGEPSRVSASSELGTATDLSSSVAAVGWSVTAVLVTTVLIATCALAADDPGRVHELLVQAKTELAPHTDGYSIDDTPGAAAALEQAWSMTGRWVADYLDARPGATAEEIQAALSSVAERATVVALGKQTFVVAIQQSEIGNVFIVARDSAGSACVWTIAHLKGRDPRFVPLSAWSAEAARTSCRARKQEADREQCGPMFGHPGRLPDDAAGHPRFYVDGTWAQSAGVEVGGQLSIWRWDGREASPLFLRSYAYTLDAPVGTRLEGDLLKVRAKEWFRAFYTAAPEQEKRVDWTVRVTPSGVEDLGKTVVTPELEVVDELLDRTWRRLPPGDLATSEAAAALARLLESIRTSLPQMNATPFGMLMSWKLTPARPGETLCLQLDATTFFFTLERHDGAWRVTSASEADRSCS